MPVRGCLKYWCLHLLLTVMCKFHPTSPDVARQM